MSQIQKKKKTYHRSKYPLSDPHEVFQYLYGDKICNLFMELKELTKGTTVLHRLRDSDQLTQFILQHISLSPYDHYLEDSSESEEES